MSRRSFSESEKGKKKKVCEPATKGGQAVNAEAEEERKELWERRGEERRKKEGKSVYLREIIEQLC